MNIVFIGETTFLFLSDFFFTHFYKLWDFKLIKTRWFPTGIWPSFALMFALFLLANGESIIAQIVIQLYLAVQDLLSEGIFISIQQQQQQQQHVKGSAGSRSDHRWDFWNMHEVRCKKMLLQIQEHQPMSFVFNWSEEIKTTWFPAVLYASFISY